MLTITFYSLFLFLSIFIFISCSFFAIFYSVIENVYGFKVTGIIDLGTFIKFGADDLDQINNILNGEDFELDILIDNEWSFNANTQLMLYIIS